MKVMTDVAECRPQSDVNYLRPGKTLVGAAFQSAITV